MLALALVAWLAPGGCCRCVNQPVLRSVCVQDVCVCVCALSPQRCQERAVPRLEGAPAGGVGIQPRPKARSSRVSQGRHLARSVTYVIVSGPSLRSSIASAAPRISAMSMHRRQARSACASSGPASVCICSVVQHTLRSTPLGVVGHGRKAGSRGLGALSAAGYACVCAHSCPALECQGFLLTNQRLELAPPPGRYLVVRPSGVRTHSGPHSRCGCLPETCQAPMVSGASNCQGPKSGASVLLLRLCGAMLRRSQMRRHSTITRNFARVPSSVEGHGVRTVAHA